ncbi:MAG: hypothetical protein M5U24_11485 [Candidatus Kuenenia sp.]|uniref:hypothetical protein n=1 Tax=Candidatus Kuenenia sp. TaxID=2499824 RepID=UPI0022C7F236|nr:hypothetical protein [Candidatus Kuenenia sp.]MCZ7623080.1 hypothetical protein [Candidatus Kuenenia sp.]
MKNIWAPWRVTYIKNASEKEACFLCEAYNGSSEEEKHIIRMPRRAMFLHSE